MYTNAKTPAQFLHNCLILVNAMHAVNLTIDIKVNDFTIFTHILCFIFNFFLTFIIAILYIKYTLKNFSESVLFHDVLLYDGNQNTASYKYT